MQQLRTRIICGLALFVALGLATSAIAQRPGGRGHGGPGGDSTGSSSSAEGSGERGPGGRGSTFGLGHFAREINLTDAQRAQIATIYTTYLTSTAALRTQLQTLRDANPLNQVPTSFNETQITQAAQARAAVQVQLDVAAARAQVQVYNVLTADQRTLLAQLIQQHTLLHQNR